MILKHVLEDLAKLNLGDYAETNIESVEPCYGRDVYFELGSKEEDIRKIEELEGDLIEIKRELEELKTEIGRQEFIDGARRELENLRKNIEGDAARKVKRWEEFAHECYNSLTPKWKEKMQYRVIEMNKFIAESNDEANKYGGF